MESNGKASEKHGKKLGRFFKFGNSKNNRFSYRHENGDSYLYWQKGVWMVSLVIKNIPIGECDINLKNSQDGKI